MVQAAARRSVVAWSHQHNLCNEVPVEFPPFLISSFFLNHPPLCLLVFDLSLLTLSLLRFPNFGEGLTID